MDTQHEINKIEYDNYAYEKDLLYIRPVLLMSAILYGLFGILDYLFYPDHLSLFLTIRFAVVIPLILIGILYTYHHSYRKTYQCVLTFLMVISALGIIIMVYVIPGKNYYYSGVSLVLAIAFLLLRIKTFYALIGGITIITLFLLIGILFTDVSFEEIFANTLFYISFVFVGTIGSIYIERFRKNQYYHESIIEGEKVVLEKTVFEQYENIKNYNYATIQALAYLAESRDQVTGDHIQRVGELSYLLTKSLPDSMFQKLNISKLEFLEAIRHASLLHDIGKTAISDVILNKPAKLTKEEFEIVKKHTTIGYETLLAIKEQYGDNPFINLGIEISRSHHEWYNGKGYPDGLSKEEIPLSARIVAIIDVYDALVSKRPYKEPFSKQKSIQIIKDGIGTQFDPIIAQNFVDIVEQSNDPILFGLDE